MTVSRSVEGQLISEARICIYSQRRRQPSRSGGVRMDGGGSGGQAPEKFFGATPFKTMGNAHFEDRNTPF